MGSCQVVEEVPSPELRERVVDGRRPAVSTIRSGADCARSPVYLVARETVRKWVRQAVSMPAHGLRTTTEESLMKRLRRTTPNMKGERDFKDRALLSSRPSLDHSTH